MILVIVDTPLKAKTVWSALSILDPKAWIVLDYPVPPSAFSRKSSGGVNVTGGFEPQFVPANQDRLDRIIQLTKEASIVYLYFDNTLEGEESAVYLLNALAPHTKVSNIKRIRTNILTKKNIHKSIEKHVSFDLFSAEKSENLRVLDRMIAYHVGSSLGADAAPNHSVGLCGYYMFFHILKRAKERASFIEGGPEFKVLFRANNGAFVRSVDNLLHKEATVQAERAVSWLKEKSSISDVVVEDVVFDPPSFHTMDSLVLDCISDGSMRLSQVLDVIVSLYHEGLITNPFLPQKITTAYIDETLKYLREFGLEINTSLSSHSNVYDVDLKLPVGIVPIDIRLDINKLRHNYRYVYQKLWQRTLHAHGLPTVLSKTSFSFGVSEGRHAADVKFSGVYHTVVRSGFKGFFGSLRDDKVPDILRDVVLEKQISRKPEYYTEESLIRHMQENTPFSLIEINNALKSLYDSDFLRGGTSNLLIPTFRGWLLGNAVQKYLVFLQDLVWVKDIRHKIGISRPESRAAMADVWQLLKPAAQELDKHKFLCEQCCTKCGSSLDLIFDKKREPYLLCKKTTSSGCGTVFPVLLTDNDEIKIFEPYLVSRSCPKCELFNMRCYNGPYGLFVRCDTCKTTQPFE